MSVGDCGWALADFSVSILTENKHLTSGVWTNLTLAGQPILACLSILRHFSIVSIYFCLAHYLSASLIRKENRNVWNSWRCTHTFEQYTIVVQHADAGQFRLDLNIDYILPKINVRFIKHDVLGKHVGFALQFLSPTLKPKVKLSPNRCDEFCLSENTGYLNLPSLSYTVSCSGWLTLLFFLKLVKKLHIWCIDINDYYCLVDFQIHYCMCYTGTYNIST